MNVSHEEFMSALEAGLAAAEGVTDVHREDARFHVARRDGIQMILESFNFWRAVENGRNTVAGVVEIAVRTVLEGRGQPASWAEIAYQIFARLERRDLLDREGLPSRPWLPASVLREGLVEDHPETMWWITAEHLASWDIPLDAVYTRARRNLWRLVQQGQRPRQIQAKVWMLATEDGYGASRLLFPDWLERALPARYSRDGWLLSAPSRNVLLAMPAGTGHALDLITAATVVQRRYPHPWPRNAVLLHGGQLEPLDDPQAGAGPVSAA